MALVSSLLKPVPQPPHHLSYSSFPYMTPLLLVTMPPPFWVSSMALVGNNTNFSVVIIVSPHGRIQNPPQYCSYTLLSKLDSLSCVLFGFPCNLSELESVHHSGLHIVIGDLCSSPTACHCWLWFFSLFLPPYLLIMALVPLILCICAKPSFPPLS